MIKFLKNIAKKVDDFFAPRSVSFSRKGVLENVIHDGQRCLAVVTKRSRCWTIPLPSHMPQKVLDCIVGQSAEYTAETVFSTNILVGFCGSAYFFTQTNRHCVKILSGIFSGHEFYETISVKTL